MECFNKDGYPELKCPADARGDLWNKIQEKHQFPLCVMIAVTSRCNLRCGHCYLLSKPEYNELILQAGVLQLILTGGEPALRSDLIQIVRQAAQRRFYVTLKSNGTLLDDDIVNKLWQAGLSELQVSLYHPDAKRHDEFVGLEGAHYRATSALVKFHSLGGIARVNLLIMDWNAGSLGDLIDFCEINELRYAADLRVEHRIDGDGSPCRLRAGSEALISTLADSRLYNRLFLEGEQYRKTASMPLCRASEDVCVIMPGGDVWPCQVLPWPLGNIRETPFDKIWLDSARREQLKKSLVWGKHDECLKCEISWACQRCPGDAFLEHGNVEAPTEYDCELAEIVSKVRKLRSG
jgi:radical SAM protein with 4Fe4S-binding SPASM domain